MLKPLKHKFSYGGIVDRLCRMRKTPESQADVLLALSREEVEKLKKRYPEKQVELFPNGILHRELPEEGDFRKQYKIPEDQKVILCISRIDYQKNQKILLELLKKYDDTHLLLIGCNCRQSSATPACRRGASVPGPACSHPRHDYGRR